jgi:hypothetical protein
VKRAINLIIKINDNITLVPTIFSFCPWYSCCANSDTTLTLNLTLRSFGHGSLLRKYILQLCHRIRNSGIVNLQPANLQTYKYACKETACEEDYLCTNGR